MTRYVSRESRFNISIVLKHLVSIHYSSKNIFEYDISETTYFCLVYLHILFTIINLPTKTSLKCEYKISYFSINAYFDLHARLLVT